MEVNFSHSFFGKCLSKRLKYSDVLVTEKKFSFFPISGEAHISFFSIEFEDETSLPKIFTAKISDVHEEIFKGIDGSLVLNSVFEYVKRELPAMLFDSEKENLFSEFEFVKRNFILEEISSTEKEGEDISFVLSFSCDEWDAEHGIEASCSLEGIEVAPGSFFS